MSDDFTEVDDLNKGFPVIEKPPDPIIHITQSAWITLCEAIRDLKLMQALHTRAIAAIIERLQGGQATPISAGVTKPEG